MSRFSQPRCGESDGFFVATFPMSDSTLYDCELTATQRSHGQALLIDLLTPIPVTALEVRFPDDQIAGPVARALRENPADQRTAADWGRAVGASERTLARGCSRYAGAIPSSPRPLGPGVFSGTALTSDCAAITR
ncbi:MAG TPA: hypothetical protein VGG83_02270 [Trebonia sp.]